MPRWRNCTERPVHRLPRHRRSRALPAARGFAVPDRPGVWLRTGPHARPDRDAYRGHSRAVPAAPQRQGRGGRGLPGLANEFPAQVSAPPKKPKNDAPLGEQYARREMRHPQFSARICVEHANAELRQWHPLQRYTGPRDRYAGTYRAIVSLVSDRSARRAARHKPSSELVPARRIAG